MAVSDSVARNIGKLFRNLHDPKWYVAEASKRTIQITVINKFGNSVRAYLRAHLYHGQEHIANVYHDDDGHEYVNINGEKYRLDYSTEAWKSA